MTGPQRQCQDLCLSGPKVRFVFTMVIGWFLSGGWFLLHYQMTQIHSRDSEIINHTGRLRFYTQRVGVLLLERMVLSASGGEPDLDEIEYTLQQMQSTCRQLLGEDTAGESKGPPEMLDTDVKESLREWITENLESLLELASGSLEHQHARTVVSSVDSATLAVDKVVNAASEASNGRVEVLSILSISRACLGVLWAVMAVAAFSSAWRPYVRTHNQLQASEQQRKALLRAAFDVVISVYPATPFQIAEDSPELSHLLGQPVLGKSMLHFTSEADERDRLKEFLSRELELPTCSSEPSLPERWWWNLTPHGPLCNLPVAPMIRSQWLAGAGSDQVLHVEILVVGSADSKIGRDHRVALLAVRGVALSPCPTPRRCPEVPAPAEPPEEPQATSSLNAPQLGFATRAASRGRTDSEGRRSHFTHVSSETQDTQVPPTGPVNMVGALTPRSEQEDTPPPTLLGMPTESSSSPAVPAGGFQSRRPAQEAVLQQAAEVLRGFSGEARDGGVAIENQP